MCMLTGNQWTSLTLKNNISFLYHCLFVAFIQQGQSLPTYHMTYTIMSVSIPISLWNSIDLETIKKIHHRLGLALHKDTDVNDEQQSSKTTKDHLPVIQLWKKPLRIGRIERPAQLVAYDEFHWLLRGFVIRIDQWRSRICIWLLSRAPSCWANVIRD